MIIGRLLVGLIFCNIVSTLASSITAKFDLDSRLQIVKNQIDSRLGKGLFSRVVEHFSNLWMRSRGANHRLFRDLPFCLQTELSMHMFGSHLRELPLFANTSDAFLRALSLRLHQFTALPCDEILKQGDVSSEMYIVHSGTVEICQKDSVEADYIQSSGAYFDDINLVYSRPHSHTIKALTHVDALTLSKSDLQEVMEQFPVDAEKIRTHGEMLYDDGQTIQEDACQF